MNDHTSAPLKLPALHELPLAWRALLTGVALFLGAGYFSALVNVYAQDELTDGRPGLSAQDLLLKYSGGYVDVVPGEAPPSRMLEMIQGEMRQYFSSDEHYESMLAWLRGGARREEFSGDDDLTPEIVLISDCLRCHAADGGEEIGRKSPLGADLFTPDYELVAALSLATEPGQTRVWRAPRDWRSLAMSTHAHLLSVPMFVVLLAALFLWSGWLREAPAPRTLLACAPLALFLADVACWWLARIPEIGWVFALAIGGIGALFGLSYGVQWVVVLRALWGRRMTNDE